MRCTFVKGLVEQTLPQVLEKYSNRRKFINLDLDLYSGTQFVLNQMAPLFLTGDVILFDEFTIEEHEYKAYQEYIAMYGDTLKLIGKSFNQYVFTVK